MQFISMRVLIRRIMALKSYILDRSVSKWKKLLVLFGVIYLISPIDLVPEPVLGLGIIDDVTLWGFILWYLKDELDSYDENINYERSDRKIRRSMRGKNIYEADVKIVGDDEVEGSNDQRTGL